MYHTSHFFTGQTLKFSKTFKVSYQFLPSGAAWETEPLDCALIVVKRTSNAVFFDCCQDCGCHDLRYFDQEFFDNCAKLIDDPPLIEIDTTEASELGEVPLQRDEKYIFSLITNRSLLKKKAT